MSMQLGLLQTARMEQRLVQSPQVIQAMQTLQLSSLDLQERIEQELLEDPLLERAAASSARTHVAHRRDRRHHDGSPPLRPGRRRDPGTASKPADTMAARGRPCSPESPRSSGSA